MSPYPLTMAMHPQMALDTGREVERHLLEPWRDTDRSLFPTHLNYGEPARVPLDPHRMAVPDGPWTAKRKRPPVELSFGGNAGKTHAALIAEFGVDDPTPVVAIADTVARSSDVYFGMVHRLVNADRDEALRNERPDVHLTHLVRLTAVSEWGYTVETPRGLPTLFWRTYFGPPYIDLIGRDLLRRTPAWEVSEVGHTIAVTLTKEPPVDETWSRFAEVRAAAISHLGADLFWPSAARTPILRLPYAAG